MIYAVSEIGDMMDFLKNNPAISYDDYMWGLSVPMISIMRADGTHLRHLSKKEQEKRKKAETGLHIGGDYGFDNVNDLGGKIFD